MYDFNEALGLAVALHQVNLYKLLDYVRDVGSRKRRAKHLAQRCAGPRVVGIALISADLDLVPLLAVLIDTEDADVADVVVAAGVLRAEWGLLGAPRQGDGRRGGFPGG